VTLHGFEKHICGVALTRRLCGVQGVTPPSPAFARLAPELFEQGTT